MKYFEICEALKGAGIEDYNFEARVLLEELFGSCREETDYESEALSAALARRCEHYPLQYILGKWWFYDCEFFVDENCLIPRADTEILVDIARKILPDGRFADLCAGSGCIGVTLLHKREGLFCDAVEKFPETLELAKKNASHNGVSDRYNPICADIFSGDCLSGKYMGILSNPPYIKREVLGELSDEVKCEPQAALDGGVDGLDFYRAILELYADNLCDGGVFIFEIGYDQADDIAALAKACGMECKIHKDYGGNPRVAVINFA